MTGREVFNKVNGIRTPEQFFVKWNRKENDFVDFDLIDRFLENLSAGEEIGDFSLLTMDEMWGEIKRIAGDRVHIIKSAAVESVEWRHTGKSGLTTQTCLYSPDTLMTIFDIETKGDPIG